jgi:hypothetical protein
MDVRESIEVLQVRLFLMPTKSGSREAVIIEVVEKDVAFASRKIAGEIEEFDNRKLILLTADEVNASVSISARSKDLLFKGTVIGCVPRAGIGWAVHIRLSRTLLVV